VLGAGDRGGISFSQKMNLGILAGRSSAAGAEDLFPHGLRNFTGEEDSDIGNLHILIQWNAGLLKSPTTRNK